MKKATGDDEDEEKQKLESKSDYARAFQMFQDGRPLTEVAIELDMNPQPLSATMRTTLSL